MTMQILDIVVFSHDGRRRTIALSPGQVNIITGSIQDRKVSACRYRRLLLRC